ncbi:hypothetical protein [Xanthomonas arboricola]|uniref:hypothetical protein n=1 Tax=Xanthomonas arboricola TaxID=56448 RepID=UPI000CEF0795|nr:hypothetical protein [Xanthomonas arboricola]CAG2087971.1 hypothetical protein XCY_001548 [Xanthomonas arboricola pv. juglandis]
MKFEDLKDQITVALENVGVGPMRMLSLRVLQDGVERFDALHKATSLKSCEWFVDNIDRRHVGQMRQIVLLRFARDPMQAGADIGVLRLELSRLEIALVYTDVYGTRFDAYRRSLEWFGRHG